MRNEALVGYLLHQRPYQEKRALYYLFSQQHGVIHGVGKKARHYLCRYSFLLLANVT
nr:recombination protein O N-terminal domain-containing protein [Psychrobacter sp. JCM 18900]